ncbi:hypothetical protein SEMRO_451_G145710.1 [Seminavis robusta]|uniref:Uncharacterized protein n=1 Tax=Seminavis robusta TaxID=568900 RepID=A0A9N8DXW5_9STRA|nr:hypothetical protein SEMRO_451_G145710.1 [Seminavis robusta]|eukprot:Sro451_g145710.1 n/a (116) ;mRNA; r:39113-39460
MDAAKDGKGLAAAATGNADEQPVGLVGNLPILLEKTERREPESFTDVPPQVTSTDQLGRDCLVGEVGKSLILEQEGANWAELNRSGSFSVEASIAHDPQNVLHIANNAGKNSSDT